MMVKGDLSLYMYLMLVVIIGLFLIIFIGSKMSPLDFPEGRAKELAIVTAMHIDALSSVSEGGLKIDTGEKRYDVEVQRWSGFWRGVGSAITSMVSKNGNYVVVTPYDDKDARLDKQSSTFFINSYDTDKDYGTPKIENTSTVCITKDAKDSIAKLVKCE